MRTFKASRLKSHAPDADGKPLCGREGSTGEGYVTCKRCVEKMSAKVSEQMLPEVRIPLRLTVEEALKAAAARCSHWQPIPKQGQRLCVACATTAVMRAICRNWRGFTADGFDTVEADWKQYAQAVIEAEQKRRTK
jgi:hypothetical protein